MANIYCISQFNQPPCYCCIIYLDVYDTVWMCICECKFAAMVLTITDLLRWKWMWSILHSPYLSLRLSVHPSIHLSVHLSISPSIFRLGFQSLQQNVLAQWFCHLIHTFIWVFDPYWFWSRLSNFWSSGGQNGVWLWNFHTFCIPLSNWWKVVNGTGVFCPCSWAQFVIIGQHCHLNDNTVNFKGQSNVGQLMDKVHNEEHIRV